MNLPQLKSFNKSSSVGRNLQQFANRSALCFEKPISIVCKTLVECRRVERAEINIYNHFWAKTSPHLWRASREMHRFNGLPPTPPHLSSTFLFLSTSSQFGLTNGVKLDKVDSNLNSLRDSTGFHVRRGDHTRAIRGDSEKVLWDFSGERDELWILSFAEILLEPTYLEREEKSWNQ